MKTQGKMSLAEEITLVSAWRDHRDKKALEKLINCHMGMITKIAYGYVLRAGLREDARSEGVIGFMRAVDTWDVNKGARLMSYARWNVYSAVQRFAHKEACRGKVGCPKPDDGRQKDSCLRGISFDKIDVMPREIAYESSMLKADGRPTDISFLDKWLSEEFDLDGLDRKLAVEVIQGALQLFPTRGTIGALLLHHLSPDEPVLKELAAVRGCSKQAVSQQEFKGARAIRVLLRTLDPKMFQDFKDCA